MDNKVIQQSIEANAKQRSYWRGMKAILSDKSSVVADGLTSRIRILVEEYANRLSFVDPTDSVEVAKAQEGKLVCSKILLDFDVNICEEKIAELDKSIRGLNKMQGRG